MGEERGILYFKILLVLNYEIIFYLIDIIFNKKKCEG